MATIVSVIVPTLNEEVRIGNLLDSLSRQDCTDFETIVVDGGSKDRTLEIASQYGAKTLLLPGCREFPSRNAAAEQAEGEILLFTGADVIFPDNLISRTLREFENGELLALTGPGIPYDIPFLGKMEYKAYNTARYTMAKLPKPLKSFSTSTNLLAVRKSAFQKTDGFSSDMNGDGLMGRKLCQMGKVRFSFSEVHVHISGRRMKDMGFIRYNLHFLYVLENFFPFLSRTRLIDRLKGHSRAHREKQEHEDIEATV